MNAQTPVAWAVRGSSRLKLSDETRDIASMIDKSTIYGSIATAVAEQLSTGKSFLFGEEYIGMSEAEFVDHQIKAMVDRQMGAIVKTLEMANSVENSCLIGEAFADSILILVGGFCDDGTEAGSAGGVVL